MAEPLRCHNCGAEIVVTAPVGLCPKCVMRTALESGLGEGLIPSLPKLRHFGDYELLEEIARGGMGVVYKARQISLGRTVAVKMMRPGLMATEGEVRRFRTEATIVAQLLHTNIVAIHEAGDYEGFQYFSMDYVEGPTLAATLREGPLGAKEAAQCLKTISEAVHYAHGMGVLHRDLKPSNVIFDGSGQPRITDFGLARPLVSETELTMSGAVLGTPGYMSPEQASGKSRELTAASDVYSLGAMLYELVTGRAPFRGATPLETVKQVIECEPVPPRSRNPDLPRNLETICLKCLQKDPHRRYPSAKVLAEDLGRFLQGEPITARQIGLAQGALRWGRRHPWPCAAAAAVLIAATLAVFASRATPADVLLTPVPLTSLPGRQACPALSPDGSLVAFSWSGEKRDALGIYVKPVGSGVPLRLTADPSEEISPAWSPDGRTIAFLRRANNASAALFLAPSTGGRARQLADLTAPDIGFEYYRNCSALSWTPDGKWILSSSSTQGRSTAGVIAFATQSGERRVLTSPQAPAIGDFGIALSPNGGELAFVRFVSMSVGELYLLPLSSDLLPAGAARQMTWYQRGIYSPIWKTNGREILFTRVEPEYMKRVWSVRPSGAGSHPLPLPADNIRGVTVSRRGNRLAYERDTTNFDIWRVEVPVSGNAAAARFTPVVVSARGKGNPQFSPDGRKIAFQSAQSGNGEIWICERDGSNVRQITNMHAYINGFPRWSPDGRRIAFHSRVKGLADIFAVDALGGAPVPLTKGLGDAYTPSWSHDGKWAYFALYVNGPSPDVWKTPAEGGKPIRITFQGGEAPLESPDGKWVYYVKFRDSSVWRCPAEGGLEELLVRGVETYGWTIVADGVYYLKRADPEQSVLNFLRVSTRKTTLVATIPSAVGWALSVSPDRREILYTKQQPGSDLMLVEGFR